MEIFDKKKLTVAIEGDVLVVDKQLEADEIVTDKYDFTEMLSVFPFNKGKSIAFATKTESGVLEMNQDAVNRVVEKWQQTSPYAGKLTLLFEKKASNAMLTPDGYFVWCAVTVEKTCFCLCPKTSANINVVKLSDVLVFKIVRSRFGKTDVFFCSKDNAIEIRGLDATQLNLLQSEIQKAGARYENAQTYTRSFKLFALKKHIEYIFTTDEGVAYYCKHGGNPSEFCFDNWDCVQYAFPSNGCCSKHLTLMADRPFSTKRKFPAGSVNSIVGHVMRNVNNNAGSGVSFGRGRNKVIVTDTHLLCFSKGNLAIAHQKPFLDPKCENLVSRSLLSSTIDFGDENVEFKVKVGRYAWKPFCGCCCGGKFRKAAGEMPGRSLESSADEQRLQ